MILDITSLIIAAATGKSPISAVKKAFGGSPKAPTADDAAEAARKREEELRMRKGRGASIVTGGGGLTTEPPLGRTSLLGAG